MNTIFNAVYHTSILEFLPEWLKQFIGLTPSQPQYLSCKISKNTKGKLGLVSKSHSTNLVTYELIHEDGKGAILVSFNHLGKLRNELDQSILKNVAAGNLIKAETLCKQRKNMHIDQYTHRLQIFRVKKEKHLLWLIDIDFHKTDSYGSGTGVKIITSCLESLLNTSLNHPKYGDSLDNLLDQNLIEILQKKAEEFYPYFSQKRIKCMVSPHRSLCQISSPIKAVTSKT